MTEKEEGIIVALDVATGSEALALVGQLRDQISLFKVGLQLYTAGGPDIVRAITQTGAKVFLDLKLHDIPNTVGRAVQAAAELNVKMLTIHLSGGQEMIRAAVDARKNMSILGVTVLTSATDETLRETGVPDKIDDQVVRLAKLGVKNGIKGLVASAHEVKRLRAELGENLTIVVPGIRPSWSGAGDQKRTMTPQEALAAGADYLVIGRPITANPDPRKAVTKILTEIAP